MTATLAVGALFLAIAAALVLIRLHTLPTGLDPRRDAVSDYGATAFHLYYRAMVVMLGLSAACLAIALHRTGDVRTSGQIWLWIFAASRVAIAGFMTVTAGTARHGRGADPPAARRRGVHVDRLRGAD